MWTSTTGHAATRCAVCRKRLVWQAGIGWVDPDRYGCWDMCEADPYGNHWPT